MASSSPPAPTSRRTAVLGLFGPTASGKTAVAALLRDRLDAVVVSADSAALYEGLPILTAAPDYPAELVGVVPLAEDVSVGEYQTRAHAAVDTTLAAGRLPVVVGGTGLYFRAALASLALPPPPAEGRRAFWQKEYDRFGAEQAHALLAERDPAAAARVHANDRKRVVRALELAEAGGSLAPATDTLWRGPVRHPTLVVALDAPLDELDRRIHRRTLEMVERGAVEEATRAWSGALSPTARKVLGLEQFATLTTGPAEELADAIVALAGAGERLPRH
jgi:tRNA dimethylallyltransferase